MIECRNVSFDATDFEGEKHPLLRDISFTIEEGEKLVLFGINGSGKSTLLKLLNGLEQPKSGEILYGGEAMDKRYLKANKGTFRRENVLQMQDPNSMLFNTSVYEEIAFGPRTFGFDDVDERVKHFAELFGVTKLLERAPYRLSGGEKQRVLLASLLAVEPKFLMMDEPTAHLDPPTTGWLVELLQEMNITTLLCTHNLSLGRELGTRALVLGPDHTLHYDGPVDALFDDLRILDEARLLHRHRHTHGGSEHTHAHLHDWA
ncbi:ABC transporter ATP-binding protein [Sulfurimonas sp. HSL-1656]|uniref:energy-coupling factor ABC transporter ATP-binding protein n=1 Tax=Thiomicrolovo subterrani TaxID=3131934 RepID=UPI0031F853BE